MRLRFPVDTTSPHLESARSTVQARLKCERLEDRSTPANLVTAQLVGTTLWIKGLDDLSALAVLSGDNNQSVVITGVGAGAFDVDVAGSTQFLLPNQSTSTATQSFKGVNSIRIEMGLGDDVVVINNAQISGELSFTGGHGNDQLRLGDAPGNQVYGKITLNNGDGDDVFVFGGGNNKVLGDLRINNGTGNSLVSLNVLPTDELSISGNLAISNSDGFDKIIIVGKLLLVNGNIAVTNGSGNSLTQIVPKVAQINGSVSLVNGEGFDDIALGFNDGTSVGSFVVNNGLSIQNKGGGSRTVINGIFKYGRKFDLQSGNGFDALTIGSLPGGSLTGIGDFNVVTGSGGSELSIEGTAAQITGRVTITNGPGFDNIQWMPNSLTINGPLSISNGSGGSYVGLSPAGPLTLSSGAKITNGAGEDTLVVGGASTTTISAKGLTVTHGHGGSNTFVSAAKVLITAPVTLSAGDSKDVFSLSGQDLQVTGHVTFKAGNGNAEAYFTPTSSLNILGGVSIENGAGDLLIAYGNAGATSTSKGLSYLQGNGSSNVVLDGAVTVNGAINGKSGEGFAKLSVLGDLTVNGSVAITRGAGGSDTFLAGKTTIAGALTLNNSDGTDLFIMTGSTFDVSGAVHINQGDGEAAATGTPSTVRIAAGKTLLSGGLNVKALSGNDLVQISGSVTAKSISIDLGADAGTIQCTGPMTVLNNLFIQTGHADDSIVIENSVSVGGTTTLRTNAGDDEISWTGGINTLLGAVTIDTGEGHDLVVVRNWIVKAATKVTLGSGHDTLFLDDSQFTGPVILDAGAGSDEVYIEALDTGSKTIFQNSVSVSMGDGDDLLWLANANDSDDVVVFNGAVNVNGGVGLDSLFAMLDRFNTFAISPTAINWEVLI